MKQLIIVLSLTLFIFNGVQAEELKVGVTESKPFVYQENGEWKGIEITLLNELSESGEFTYEIVEFETVPALLEAARTGTVDMSLSALSMTAERENTVDFSHSYFKTPLGILSKDSPSTMSNFMWMAKKLFIIFILFIVALYIIGYIMDKIDGDKSIKGPHEGAWWALVTFTTTGYGDLVPSSSKGKALAAFWMVASLFLISIFTGYVASSMTVKKLTESTTTLADLYDAKVLAIAGTTGELKLADLGISYKTANTLNEAMDRFNNNKVDAVVYDKAILDYLTLDQEGVSVHEINNSDEYYAIAISPKSNDIMQRINLGILNVLLTPKWKAEKVNYFGTE